MFGLRGGEVPIPRGILIFRGLQLCFAILVLGLTAYSLSIRSGSPIEPPIVANLIISTLTIFPILILTTPLHYTQRKIYDARIALFLDMFAALFWLAAFAVLACYEDVLRRYGRSESLFESYEERACPSCRAAWKAGAAACVFASLEFLLFLFTALTFAYYYHCYLAGESAPGAKYPAISVTKPYEDDATASTTSPCSIDFLNNPAPAPEEHQMMCPQLTIATHHLRENYGDAGLSSGDTPHNLPYPTISLRSSGPCGPRSPRGSESGGYGDQSGYQSGYGFEALRQ